MVLMAVSLSRRALLRGRIAGTGQDIRPPWAVLEADFTNQCNRCGDCVRACAESIIRSGDGGYPVVDFKKGECTFCGDCVAACDSGAISPRAFVTNLPPWHLVPSIQENCLAYNRVVCRSCAEQCEQQAIRFRPAAGGVSRPELHLERCNGCGACVSPCPVASIVLESYPSSDHRRASKQEAIR